MTTPAKDGGPAFPQPFDSIENTEHGRELASGWTGMPDPGMSLRAFIAAQNMAAIIAVMGNTVTHNNTEKFAAEMAVLFADALIAELRKP